MAVFGNKGGGLNVKLLLFSNPEKAHPRLTYFAWKLILGPWLWAVGRTRKKRRVNIFDAQFRTYGEKKPLEGSWLNFACVHTFACIRDVITFATFCDDRLRGLGVARGWISHFPIDLRRRPYNTLALPCECVKCEYERWLDRRTIKHRATANTTLTRIASRGKN